MISRLKDWAVNRNSHRVRENRVRLSWSSILRYFLNLIKNSTIKRPIKDTKIKLKSATVTNSYRSPIMILVRTTPQMITFKIISALELLKKCLIGFKIDQRAQIRLNCLTMQVKKGLKVKQIIKLFAMITCNNSVQKNQTMKLNT